MSEFLRSEFIILNSTTIAANSITWCKNLTEQFPGERTAAGFAVSTARTDVAGTSRDTKWFEVELKYDDLERIRFFPRAQCGGLRMAAFT